MPPRLPRTSEIFACTALKAFCHESGRSEKFVSWVMGLPFLAISTPTCCGWATCAPPKRLGEDWAPSSDTAEDGDKKLGLDDAPNMPPDGAAPNKLVPVEAPNRPAPVEAPNNPPDAAALDCAPNRPPEVGCAVLKSPPGDGAG